MRFVAGSAGSPSPTRIGRPLISDIFPVDAALISHARLECQDKSGPVVSGDE